MHKNFADWYNAVSLRPDAQVLDARWKSVEMLADRLTLPQVPSLVRVFFSLPLADRFSDEIRDAARQTDATYLTGGDENELTVLAGSMIAEVVTRSLDVAGAVALAVSCADAQGLRQARRLQGVVDEVSRYLANESVRVRMIRRDLIVDMDVDALTKVAAAKGGVAVTDVNTLWSAAETVLKAVLEEHAKHTESMNMAFQEALGRQQEQSDVLWWLFGGHTFGGEKAFLDLTVPEACFWGAKDLAYLTRFLPGFFGAPGFLHKMLRLVRRRVPAQVRISDAVDACQTEWKQDWSAKLNVQGVPDLCPMLFAVTKSAEVGGDPGWTPAFEHATGLSAHATLPPTRLALQVYNEVLLQRALAGQG